MNDVHVKINIYTNSIYLVNGGQPAPVLKLDVVELHRLNLGDVIGSR